MSTLPSIDSGTLSWVRSEIDDTAQQARQVLREYQDDPGRDTSLMRKCATHLHQVYGTLTMVELDAAARLTQESEQLAQALAKGEVEWAPELRQTLERSLDDLSGYLEALQASPPPSPLHLVDAVNRLRVAREEEPIGEVELFAPDLSAKAPEPTLQSKISPEVFLRLSDDLRVRFERALLALVRDAEDRNAIRDMIRVFQNLTTVERRSSLRQLWWVSAGLAESLLDGSIAVDNDVRLILARVNDVLKQLQDKGQAGRRRAPPDDLIKRILLLLARSDSRGEQLAAIKRSFGLDDWVRQQAAGGLASVSSLVAALSAFAGEADSSLQQAQSLLARYFSPRGGDPATLKRFDQCLEGLAKAADGHQLQVVVQLTSVMREVVTALEQGEVKDREQVSLQMAAALLFIQDSCSGALRPGVEWQKQANSSVVAMRSLIRGASADAADPESEGPEVLATRPDSGVSVAAAAEIAEELKTVERILEQVAGGETAVSGLQSIEPHLKRVEGTLEILDQADAAYLAETVRGVARKIAAESDSSPRGLDALAMGIGTLTMCAQEIISGASSGRLGDAVERAVEELQGLDGAQTPAAAPPADIPQQPAEVVDFDADVESIPLPEMPSSIPLQADDPLAPLDAIESEPRPTAGQAAEDVEEPEDELTAIFYEEARDVERELSTSKAAWRRNPDDEQALADLRRCFHTLKGSGRFAEATAIAELSWAVEDLLNSIIDGDIEAAEPMHDFVDRAHGELVGLIATENPQMEIDLAPWQREAESLKSGSAPRRQDLSMELGADLERLQVSMPADEEDEEDGLPPPLPELDFSEDSVVAPAVAMDGQSPVDGDDDVSEVFRAELEGHVAVIAASVDEARNVFPEWNITAELLRTTHTLRGVLRSVDLHPAGRMADGLDGMLLDSRESGRQLEEVDLVLLDQAGRLLRYAAARLSPNLELSTDVSLQFDELAAALEQRRRFVGKGKSMAATTPEPVRSPPPPIAVVEEDDELVDAFREEGQEILGRIGIAVDEWRSGSDSERAASALKRELHTFKGGARAVGWSVLGELAHDTESLIEVAAGEEYPGLIPVVQEVHDLCAMVVTSSEQLMRDDIERLDRRVRELIDEPQSLQDSGEEPSVTAEPETPDVETASPVANRVTDSLDIGGIIGLTERRATPPTAAAAPIVASSGDETRSVRVNTEILDELVNYAGEISILRSRLQQQISMVQSNLRELTETVTGFKEQLRDLEIESEAQMLATSERLREEGDSEFDPLELDRFTRLQTLTRTIGESLGNLVSVQAGISEFAGDADNTLQQQSHLTEGLQEGLLRTRMVSFASVVPRLRHLTRQTGRELGREVEFTVQGERVEVDRKILEQMSASFEHMIRNAISHGIEEAGARRAAGKSSQGHVRLRIEQEGNDIIIEFSDDGRGIDRKAIAEKARHAGLLGADAEMGDEDLMRILSAPGLTTATRVTQVAGRGVGMDVVSETVRRLGGTISVHSEDGVGSRFTLRVPVTLAISHALLVFAGEQMFAVPARLIVNVLRVPLEDIDAGDDQADAYMYYSDRKLPILNLASRLGLPFRPEEGRVGHVIVVRAGLREIGLRVESISDTREVVVKPLGRLLQGIPGIGSVTMLGDGSIVLIVDVPDLWQNRGVSVVADTYAVAQKTSGAITVMVVDDSMTVRNVMGRDLQNNGFEVILAKDGVDAIEQLRHTVPDILLVDLEMPRMNGFELTRRVRADENLGGVPILVITSRSGSRHRDQAIGLGASGYMSKPYRLDELVQSIRGLAGGQRAAATTVGTVH